MNRHNRITEHRRLGVIGALFVVFLGFAALLFPGPTRLSFDLSFALRPTTPINEALIVYMDERSTVELSQPPDRQWDRSLHTRLVKQLTKASAKAVVFDLLFDAPGDPQVDQELANAMAANGQVVVAARLRRVSEGGATAASLTLATAPIAHATRFGVAEMPLDNDGFVRTHYLSPENYPSLSEKAAEAVAVRPGRPARRRWLNYYGPSGFVPSVSYSDALDTNRVAGLFSGKVVFVGRAPMLTHDGTLDAFATPYTRWTGLRSPGVEVQATAVLNLIRGDWLTRFPIGLEIGLIVAVGCVFGFGFSLLRSWTAALALALTSVLAVAGGALELFWHTHVWFSWLVICVVQIPGAFAWFVYVQRKRRLFQKAEPLTPSGDYFAA